MDQNARRLVYHITVAPLSNECVYRERTYPLRRLVHCSLGRPGIIHEARTVRVKFPHPKVKQMGSMP